MLRSFVEVRAVLDGESQDSDLHVFGFKNVLDSFRILSKDPTGAQSGAQRTQQMLLAEHPRRKLHLTDCEIVAEKQITGAPFEFFGTPRCEVLEEIRHRHSTLFCVPETALSLFEALTLWTL